MYIHTYIHTDTIRGLYLNESVMDEIRNNAILQKFLFSCCNIEFVQCSKLGGFAFAREREGNFTRFGAMSDVVYIFSPLLTVLLARETKIILSKRQM
jgi:hypothetical protein